MPPILKLRQICIGRMINAMTTKLRCLVYLLLTVLLTSLIAVGCGLNKPAPKQSGKSNKNPRLIIGYYENPWPGTSEQSGSFPSLKQHAASLSAVSPFWFRATSDGTLEAKDSQVVYDTARQLGLKIYPLITNKSGATDAVLGNKTIRSKVIANIVKLVQEKNYDGVNIDFELLAPRHKANLTAFMTELYPKLKKLNKVVIISVFPKVDVADDVSGAYDYKALAANTDYIQIMTYDNHWATSEPGAIAPIDWYEKNIAYAIENCGGPQKVIIGVSAYGYDWVGKEGETVTYAKAMELAKNYGADIKYDTKAQAPWFKYEDKAGKNHEVWFENNQSTAAKLQIVAKYNPAGIAIWRLGQEQAEIWATIDKHFPKGK